MTQACARSFRLFPLTPPPPPPLQISVLISNLRCHNVMKLCMVNELIILNRFGLHIYHLNISHSAKITQKTAQKMENLKYWGWGLETS